MQINTDSVAVNIVRHSVDCCGAEEALCPQSVSELEDSQRVQTAAEDNVIAAVLFVTESAVQLSTV